MRSEGAFANGPLRRKHSDHQADMDGQKLRYELTIGEPVISERQPYCTTPNVPDLSWQSRQAIQWMQAIESLASAGLAQHMRA